MMRKAASNVHHDHLVMVPLIIMRGSLAEIVVVTFQILSVTAPHGSFSVQTPSHNV